MEMNEALDILQRIAAAYTQFDLTGSLGEKRIEVWSEQLMNMPYEPVLERLKHHILHERFAPTVAEISVKSKQDNSFLNELKQWEKDAKYAGKSRS